MPQIDRTAFASVTQPWWFLDMALEQSASLGSGRTKVAGYFGWSARNSLWYQGADAELRPELEQLYDFLAGRGQTELLNDEMLYATDDGTRTRWVGGVTQAIAEAQAEEAAKTAQTREDIAPGKEKAAVGAPGDASARRLSFKAKNVAGVPDAARAGATVGASTAPGESGGAVGAPGDAPARRSIFKAKNDDAGAPRAAPTGPGVDASNQGSVEEPANQEMLDDSVKAVIADLSPNRIGDIASQLGLTEEQVAAVVQNPDFERLVAEETERLVAQGAEDD